MNGLAVRQELHTAIDTLPEKSLFALQRLLAFLSSEPVIENDLTVEEQALIEAGMREYDRDPSCFVSIESIG